MIGPADVVYLSGPISSDPDYRAKFARAERKIRKIAPECRIVNPAKGPENLSYLEYMQRDLALIERCTVVVMLPGHTRSPGAGMEKLYAARQGKRICRLNDLSRGNEKEKKLKSTKFNESASGRIDRDGNLHIAIHGREFALRCPFGGLTHCGLSCPLFGPVKIYERDGRAWHVVEVCGGKGIRVDALAGTGDLVIQRGY